MENQSSYKRILDNLNTSVLELTADLTISYMNPAAEMLLQVSANRMDNVHISSLFLEDEDNLELLELAVKRGHPFTKRETTLHLPTREPITLDYIVTPITELHSQTFLIMELQPRDRLIRISREEEIMAKQATTQVLVRGLAHEVKNPLGGIRGAAQLLERELNDPQLAEFTNVIIEETDRLRNLVDKMLGPRKLPERIETNIHEIIERVCTLIEVETKGSVKLIRDYDPSIPEFLADPSQLIQAILNISRNAMQALQENHIDSPSICFKTRALRQFTIGAQRHRLVCQLDIIDNGPGIPEDILENIFYPMISGRAEGTGLGLSISQSIITQHEGLIECKSEPGKTAFTIYLPLELSS
ncbi:nitrogen regulation protein NR(II) [Litoribrevibacter albus]|uniref:Sensory histidine kinase/phosphatase NtrB n=1 Tax=Litoribrevibacter albus TaxID=1473156 RepID=A0AA37SFK1_9GAMM|nr:nitrogen regulation protein NR(II) [Litoribrevibacter albus]GLQ33500.1 PAS domain-containing sensor histidine kinase [Litoribrevibacter albus]